MREMKHCIIGTAGHIDHGKTTLIRALTGRNTDRLKEEQRRGITIELGFTWFDLKDGTRCGVVDVPGHEKFVGTMVSGAAGMDLVLMVIAADEGIMPQTREHLDILELLGIQRTILVLNKCDLVDAEYLELAEEEIREELKGSLLEKAPLVRVSAVTGEGIDALKEVVFRMVKEEVAARDESVLPRLPVDRVFTLPGFGTIVTGTLLSGTLSVGESLQIYPAGRVCRIRGLQVHGQELEGCAAGQRAALNLAGVRREEVRRGCVLAPPGSMKATRRIDVRLSMLRSSQRTLANRARLHVYTGSSAVLGRAVLLDREELGPGESGLAQLILEEDIVVRRGDRFVIRFYSPMETIGGGCVLEPDSRKRKRFDEAVLSGLRRKEAGSLAEVCEARIRESGEELTSLTALAQRTAHAREELLPFLEELLQEGRMYALPARRDTWYVHADRLFSLGQAISRTLTRYHAAYPCRPGMGKAELHSLLAKRMKQNLFDGCLQLLAERGLVRLRNGCVQLPDFDPHENAVFQAIEAVLLAALEEAGYELKRASELEWEEFDAAAVGDVIKLLSEEGKLVKLEDDRLAARELMEEAREKINAHFTEHTLLTYTQAKELFGTGRKCAKLIIAYMDSIGVTQKTGAETERTAAR